MTDSTAAREGRRLSLIGVLSVLFLGSLAVSTTTAQIPQLPPPGQAQQTLQAAVQQNPAVGDSIRRRLQASGLSPEEIRSRLAAAGYPAGLLDAYLSPAQAGQQAPIPGAQELTAIQILGLGPVLGTRMDSIRVDTGLIRMRAESLHADSVAVGNYVFGVDVFRRSTTQFLPLLAGPVPPDYKLGPGDQLVLILTGEVELSYGLTVTREGFVLIPQVGEVYVANLTLDKLRDVLYSRLGRVYSGVTRAATAKIRFDVSVANVRVNQVYVAGEVKQPGAYQISALGTTLTALYAAGGVTSRANLRQLEIHRADSAKSFDLYDYLLRGDKHNDIRLETGDVVYVPLRGKRAQITGAVPRPAIYELKSGESLPDLVRAAGGFRANAALQRVTIHRILPEPERGTDPFPRAVVDIPLAVPPASGDDPPPPTVRSTRISGVAVPGLGLEDGDSVVVDSIAPLDSALFVGIAGAVNKPGHYAWREGMTLRDLVLIARGPSLGASLQEAEIARLPKDRSKERLADTIHIPLDSSYLFGRDSAGRYLGPPGPAFLGRGAPEIALRPFDNVLILKQTDFELQRTVSVLGRVRYPGTYALTSRDERLADVIDRAGGLTPLAYAEGIRFVRVTGNEGRINVDLPEALRDRRSHANLMLQSGDSIVIPEFKATVGVVGAVNAPGSVLWERGKDLNYYLNAAGGPSWRADQGRVSVRYADGRVETRHHTLLFFHSSPTPRPGSEVLVPVRDTTAKGIDVLNVIGAVGQLTTTAVTLCVLLKKC